MAQYKAAMTRLFRAEDGPPTQEPAANNRQPKRAHPSGPLELYVVENFDFLMRFLVPLLWCLLFVIIMDRDSFIGNLYITFIGIFAAILANTVPIGGGVVYVPALAMLGVNLHLGVAFSVATMTLGNGVFGFLKWVHKDPSLVVWESFVYTVVPSSIGSFVAIVFFPPMDLGVIRTLFAVFCLCLAGLVLLAVYRGGAIDKIISEPTVGAALLGACSSRAGASGDIEEEINTEREQPVATDSEPNTINNTITAASNSSTTDQVPSAADMQTAFHAHRNLTVSTTSWAVLATVSFLAGALLVPNIGVGPALTTFLGLQIVGYAPRRAIVTGIITGGWVSLVPFLLHLLWLQDVPLPLWVMVLPGVYVGSQVRSLVPLFPFPYIPLGFICKSICSTFLAMLPRIICLLFLL